MKKLIFCFTVLSVLGSSSICALPSNLYDSLIHKNVVNIKVEEFSVDKGCSEINPVEFVTILKESLKERKSINFNIVEELENADFLIKGKIKNFVYSEDDPIDIIQPIGLIIDLAANQNYARLEFDASVYDAKKNKPVWEKHLKATLTKSDMSNEKSIPLIMKRAAKVFIKECFGRPK